MGEASWDLEGPVDTLDPAESLNEALRHFRRPFEPAAVRWKVQSAGSGWGLVIAYIDARLVIERLNLVVGGAWEDEYRAHGDGVEECALTVLGTTRRDVGMGSGTMAPKGRRSDALKRAAVKFGIGVSIYALKAVMLDATPGRDPVGVALLVKNRERQAGQKKVWSAQMTPAAERWLSERYAAWLKARGEELFGPPLGHGDEEGAAGMEGEEQPVAAPEPDAEQDRGPVLEDELAVALKDRITNAYARIRKLNGALIPPAQHRQEVAAASGSHEALEALAVERERVATEMEEERS